MRLTQRLDEISSEFAQPVIFKNPICGLQACLLEQCYPNSLFICTERDDEQTCRSIRQTRIDRFGSDNIWWSLKPSTFPNISTLSDPVEQIRAQIRDCRTDFQSEFAQLIRPAVSIEFSDVRTNPLGVLEQIREELRAMGGEVQLTDESSILKSPRDAGIY